MKTLLSLALVCIITTTGTILPVLALPNSEVILVSEVKWEQLNPARGDKSPKAATLWGDRKGTVPTGFLVKFADGFSSPPHIHNVSYRGVVISGLIHNDDPNASDMWMPTGSFWTQPKGEVHITAAKGSTNIAYIEIEKGPYLVLPVDKMFDSGERPVNLHTSNIVWLEASDTTWIEQPEMPASASEPKVAFLWGNPQENQLSGTLVKLPSGFSGKINSHGSTFRAVVIKGQLQYQVPGETDIKTLEPGSYFSSKGELVHHVSSKVGKESIIYIRTDGKFEIIPAPPKM
jgi:quercetin dioxygenase-like cupin family protein